MSKKFITNVPNVLKRTVRTIRCTCNCLKLNNIKTLTFLTLVYVWYVGCNTTLVKEIMKEAICDTTILYDTVVINEETYTVRIPIGYTIFFDLNSYDLRPEELLKLDICRAKMRADSETILYVTGGACELGGTGLNHRLGVNRALAVKDYLNSGTLNQIVVASVGENYPISRSLEVNRRVHIEEIPYER